MVSPAQPFCLFRPRERRDRMLSRSEITPPSSRDVTGRTQIISRKDGGFQSGLRGGSGGGAPRGAEEDTPAPDTPVTRSDGWGLLRSHHSCPLHVQEPRGPPEDPQGLPSQETKADGTLLALPGPRPKVPATHSH